MAGFEITKEAELNVGYDVIRYKEFRLGVIGWMEHRDVTKVDGPVISERLFLRICGYKSNPAIKNGIEYFVQCTSNALPSKYEIGATHNVEATELEEGIVTKESTEGHKNRETLRTLFRLLAFIDTLN